MSKTYDTVRISVKADPLSPTLAHIVVPCDRVATPTAFDDPRHLLIMTPDEVVELGRRIDQWKAQQESVPG